jgi:hypothetical protein
MRKIFFILGIIFAIITIWLGLTLVPKLLELNNIYHKAYGQEVNQTNFWNMNRTERQEYIKNAIESAIESDIYNKTGSHIDLDGNYTQQENQTMKAYSNLPAVKQRNEENKQWNEKVEQWNEKVERYNEKVERWNNGTGSLPEDIGTMPEIK